MCLLELVLRGRRLLAQQPVPARAALELSLHAGHLLLERPRPHLLGGARERGGAELGAERVVERERVLQLHAQPRALLRQLDVLVVRRSVAARGVLDRLALGQQALVLLVEDGAVDGELVDLALVELDLRRVAPRLLAHLRHLPAQVGVLRLQVAEARRAVVVALRHGRHLGDERGVLVGVRRAVRGRRALREQLARAARPARELLPHGRFSAGRGGPHGRSK